MKKRSFTLRRRTSTFVCGVASGLGGGFAMNYFLPGFYQFIMHILGTIVFGILGAFFGFFLEEVIKAAISSFHWTINWFTRTIKMIDTVFTKTLDFLGDAKRVKHALHKFKCILKALLSWKVIGPLLGIAAAIYWVYGIIIYGSHAGVMKDIPAGFQRISAYFSSWTLTGSFSLAVLISVIGSVIALADWLEKHVVNQLKFVRGLVNFIAFPLVVCVSLLAVEYGYWNYLTVLIEKLGVVLFVIFWFGIIIWGGFTFILYFGQMANIDMCREFQLDDLGEKSKLKPGQQIPLFSMEEMEKLDDFQSLKLYTKTHRFPVLNYFFRCLGWALVRPLFKSSTGIAYAVVIGLYHVALVLATILVPFVFLAVFQFSCYLIFKAADARSKISIFISVSVALVLSIALKQFMTGNMVYAVALLMGVSCLGIVEALYYFAPALKQKHPSISTAWKKPILACVDPLNAWFEELRARIQGLKTAALLYNY